MAHQVNTALGVGVALLNGVLSSVHSIDFCHCTLKRQELLWTTVLTTSLTRNSRAPSDPQQPYQSLDQNITLASPNTKLPGNRQPQTSKMDPVKSATCCGCAVPVEYQITTTIRQK
ncbi:hypothetical protein HDK77DRAFT_274559 [Phyllosticta capitalensis]|uniref:Uncharacterized protein n=1 Tax=Phyllosticta capitalensis TaxID=121624 RepID=A0ABR1YJ76_9PEZI